MQVLLYSVERLSGHIGLAQLGVRFQVQDGRGLVKQLRGCLAQFIHAPKPGDGHTFSRAAADPGASLLG